MKNLQFLSWIVCLAVGVVSSDASLGAQTKAILYPAIPGLMTSDLFTVNAGGKSIWTEKLRTNFDISKFPDWFIEPYTKVQQEVHQASFACDGSVEVSIEVPSQIGRVTIHPLSRGIRSTSAGTTVRFSIPGPGKYYIQIDSLPPLFLFADPVEHQSVSSSEEGVLYFGPGVHHAGFITLKDNETVYIAPGAIVYGGIRAKGVRHVRVTGRGILDGGAEFDQMVLIEDCSDVRIEGIMIRNGLGWTNTLVHCDGVTYDGVKVISFCPAGDGIDPLGSENIVIQDCFLRCTDDCIAIKAPKPGQNVKNILVQRNVMIGFAFSDGVTIGFETNADSVSDITVRNCDVILARGGSRVEGHSGFSIICDGPAVISHVLYDDVRVEKAEIKLFELNITDGTKYGVGPPGHIEDVRLKNITWAHEGPIVLQGFDGLHKIHSVTFENCSVAGKPLREVQKNVMKIGGFVDGVNVR